jgi:hypothetical protein
MSSRSRHSRRTLPTQRSAWAFAFGAWDGCTDHRDPFALEDLIAAAAELRLAIVDEETERFPTIIEGHYQVACLLATQAPGFDVHATNSTRRRSSEMKKST